MELLALIERRFSQYWEFLEKYVIFFVPSVSYFIRHYREIDKYREKNGNSCCDPNAE